MPPVSPFALLAPDLHDLPARPEPFLAINRIPIRDNGEELVDLRITNPELLTTEKCVPFVRENIAAMLRSATNVIPAGYKLLCLHRHAQPGHSIGDVLEQLRAPFKTTNPHWPTCTLRRQCNRFFAAPDTKAPPGHCTGGAVDLMLCDDTGAPLDLSSPLEGWPAAPTAVRGLSEIAAANRRLLCSVMHYAEFSNCRDEYWHWSYGDSAWAVRVGAPTACYGFIESPQ